MAQNKALAATGAAGLDDILGGGLTPNRLYLVEGMPGSGKTTLAFQFLMEGVRRGEPVLYVTLSETQEEIAAVVRPPDFHPYAAGRGFCGRGARDAHAR